MSLLTLQDAELAFGLAFVTFSVAGTWSLTLTQLRAEGYAISPDYQGADAVIVLWMAGGMAQTETFDPKKYTPFAPGVPIKNVLSTFPTIDTKVDHIKFTQGLERIGAVMDKGAVIRSFMAADLGYYGLSCTLHESSTRPDRLLAQGVVPPGSIEQGDAEAQRVFAPPAYASDPAWSPLLSELRQ